MTTHNICDACESVAHCSKNGCIPITDVRDFGAKGDGIANDSMAFQAVADMLARPGPMRSPISRAIMPTSAAELAPYCLNCESEGHRTMECNSTHSINSRSNEIDLLAQGGGWQLIETAPKNGTPVDLWSEGERLVNMRRVQLARLNVFYEAIEAGPTCVREATHWMPIPGAPRAQGGSNGE